MAFVTADQFLAHAVGDYLLQSHWMATEKVRNSLAAGIHALTYALPFACFFRASPAALAVIVGTHFAIDRWRLARYVVWAKNWIGYDNRPWAECQKTGYPDDVPPWLSVWLLIIADNVLHVSINAAALRWL